MSARDAGLDAKQGDGPDASKRTVAEGGLPDAGAGGHRGDVGTGGSDTRDASDDQTSPGGAGQGGHPDGCAYVHIVDAGLGGASSSPPPYSLDVSVTSGTGPGITNITCPLADGGTSVVQIFPIGNYQCVSSCPGAACDYCFDSPVNDLPVGPGCTANLIVSGRPGVGPGANGAEFTVTGDPQPAVDCSVPTITGDVTCTLTWPPACVSPRAECGSGCVDLTTDANHCGACNRACANGDSCVGGECVCVSNTFCSGDCTCRDLSTDNANCGACGTSCDGTCTNGRCVKRLSALYSTPDPLRLVLDATSVYWTSQVNKMPLGGGEITQLANTDADAQGIALSSDTVFFTDYSEGLVRKVSKAGGPIVTLATNQVQPRGIAVDATKVYWADEGATSGTGTVWSVPIAGGTPFQLASGGMYTSDVAVDATDVYWIDQISVMKKPLAGGAATVFAQAPGGWMLRLDANNVYWVEYASGIKQQSKTGGSPVDIASNERGAYSLAVDERFVYWSTYSDGAGIRKAPIGGGPITTVLAATTTSIAVDATSLYFTSYSDGTVSRVTPK